MSRTSISFTKPNDQWIKTQIDSEEFTSKSDVINDLIRKARDQQNHIEYIRAKLISAEARGFDSRTLEQVMDTVIADKKANGKL
ncbi:MAG: CopG family transcriptional regulator [Robiginitomaculum sp.]|nr:MAG: CopG family transcriptional regulator [Robiginitomaculum sp.]